MVFGHILGGGSGLLEKGKQSEKLVKNRCFTACRRFTSLRYLPSPFVRMFHSAFVGYIRDLDL